MVLLVNIFSLVRLYTYLYLDPVTQHPASHEKRANLETTAYCLYVSCQFSTANMV